MFRLISAAAFLSLAVSACSPPGEKPEAEQAKTPPPKADIVNVYTARHYDSDIALYDQFTEETGIKVNLLEGNSDQLIQRIENEGAFSPADVLLTVDAGRLWRGVERGVFQPLNAPEISQRVPERMRDPEGHWLALTARARVIVYRKSDGQPDGLETYEDLAEPEFANRICMRSSTNPYNQSLLASMIARDGEAAAEAWARDVVANFSRPPQGNDTALLKSVAAGECGLTLANTYYIARLAGSDDENDRAVYGQLGIIFPNQETSGTHVNISGIGLTEYAPHRENGVRLIEFLTRPGVQAEFSSGNNEYPVVTGVEAAPQVKVLGAFREDQLPASVLGANQEAAVKVFDRAGWQ